MDKKERIAEAIKNILSTMMDEVMDNVLINKPYVKEKHRLPKSLYAALVPDEILKSSHFEKEFLTLFSSVWGKLAQAIAQEAHGHCSLEYRIDGLVKTKRLKRIQQVINQNAIAKGKAKIKPDFGKELEYIKKGRGYEISVGIACDVFIHNTETDKKYAFILNAPLPDNKKTKVYFDTRAAKEKILKLLSMNPQNVDFAYYALAYNPYGKKTDDRWATSMEWFDMHKDESVLIGKNFWNFIGGAGTYKIIIREINKLGKEYRGRISSEFLSVQSPQNS